MRARFRKKKPAKKRPAERLNRGAPRRKVPARPAEPAAKPVSLAGDLKIPPILLEGDQPVPPPPAVTARPAVRTEPGPPLALSEGELPEAYGTRLLFLTPRDPRCVCAQWDLTAEQLRHYQGRAAGRQLVLRIHHQEPGGARVAELHVHPESRHWFVHVAQPGAAYVGDLGYYTTGGQWHSVSVSEPVSTPVEAPPASREPVRFARIELESNPQPRIEPARQPSAPPTPVPPPVVPSAPVQQRTPATPVPERAAERPSPGPDRPEPPTAPAPGSIPARADREAPAQPAAAAPARPAVLTPAQREALQELIGFTATRKQWLNSAQISELAGLQPGGAVAPAEAAQLGWPEASISSPAVAGPAPEEAFWFNVNAELVIYGATEPGAQVTIGRRPIALRPDGTFSCRFALPDGGYYLPIRATARHGDQRHAELTFYRGTRYSGDVGAHPQDPALKAPAVENIT